MGGDVDDVVCLVDAAEDVAKRGGCVVVVALAVDGCAIVVVDVDVVVVVGCSVDVVVDVVGGAFVVVVVRGVHSMTTRPLPAATP